MVPNFCSHFGCQRRRDGSSATKVCCGIFAQCAPYCALAREQTNGCGVRLSAEYCPREVQPRDAARRDFSLHAVDDAVRVGGIACAIELASGA
jgi:hypothetical protein